jgi:hypothetical protein
MDRGQSSDGNRIGLEFLFTELDLAMTFLDVAQTTGIQETVALNHSNARDCVRYRFKSPEDSHTDRNATDSD